jgi:hypothetical protein
MSIDNIEDKHIGRAKSKRRIHNNDSNDLADQLNSLQKALANERGESERFRQEMRAKVRLLLERRVY